MSRDTRPLLLFNYRKRRAYAFHVLMGALEHAGLDTRAEVRFVRDRQAQSDALSEAEQSGRPALVAWSFFSSNFMEAVEELAWIRERHDHRRILHIAGGVHATALPAETLRGGFDFVAPGDGERTIVDFVTAWIEGRSLAAIKGIGRLDNDRYVSGGPPERVGLDDWPPFAARDGWFNPIEITRGCVFGCRFCQAPFAAKARFRHRSVESVCHSVRVLIDRGMKDIRFITPSALSYGAEGPELRLEAVETLLARVRAETGPDRRIFFGSFPAEARPEHITTESVATLKRYVDNDNLVIGAQSGSNRVLEACNRGHTVDDVIRSVSVTLDAGFKAYAEFIFGLPGETENDLRQTMDLAEDLAARGARIHAHTFLPLPGTPFARSRPGVIGEETRVFMERLAAKGGLFGQWQAQQALAPELARLTPVNGQRRT